MSQSPGNAKHQNEYEDFDATEQMLDRLWQSRPAIADELRLPGQLAGSWDPDDGVRSRWASRSSSWARHLVDPGRCRDPDVLITSSCGDVVAYGTTVRTFDRARNLVDCLAGPACRRICVSPKTRRQCHTLRVSGRRGSGRDVPLTFGHLSTHSIGRPASPGTAEDGNPPCPRIASPGFEGEVERLQHAASMPAVQAE
jgi:hypothetical protein